jgi:hypothetical protein
MSEENQVITATTSEGDTNMMVCKTEAENRKVCMDVGEEKGETDLSKKASGEENMLENNTYNIMEQLTIENRSLWRIKNNYKRDSNLDMATKQLWDTIEKDKEELVAMLTEKLRGRL